MSERPVIVAIPTGGTIQMAGTDRLDLAWYREHHRWLPIEQILAGLPELRNIADVRPVPYEPVASPVLNTDHWVSLGRALQLALADDGVAGAVVLHGTATLEETAYFLHLTAKTSKPIVLVGAMRPPGAMSSDADLNLLNAVRVASCKESASKGVLVVLNDAIHSAREVTKGSTLRPDAFVSRDTGPLGYVDGFGTVAYYRLPAKLHTLGTPFRLPAGTLPRVDIAVSYVGSDGAAIDAFVKAGARGIVLACTAFDGRTQAEDAAVGNAIAQGCIVVFSSRVGSGRVVLSPASRRLGLVGANDLLPWKARILLMLALAETTDYRIVQGYFDEF